MVPAGQHFIVYDRIDDRVIVLTILHQVRDIEGIIDAMGAEFLAEIQTLRGRGRTR